MDSLVCYNGFLADGRNLRHLGHVQSDILLRTPDENVQMEDVAKSLKIMGLNLYVWELSGYRG